ncbi:hypothetical protein CRG98_027452 [Punica granatum]|uniref:Uncharacterized protein n=1 Tax=Punica granatum TaxID=22663 RepID=A0A2I0J8Y4_PUNGR|nr:hypothetical protein CRG98_027452 [Punica granatum]
MKEQILFAISMQGRWGSNWPSKRRASAPRDMNRVRRGGILIRRGRTRSVVLVDALGQAKRPKVIDPAVGEVDHGGCARIGGCPGRCAGLGLRRLGGILVC